MPALRFVRTICCCFVAEFGCGSASSSSLGGVRDIDRQSMRRKERQAHGQDSRSAELAFSILAAQGQRVVAFGGDIEDAVV